MRDRKAGNISAAAIIHAIVVWAKAEPRIRAVALVGSYARGTAGVASDIDLVLLTTDPHAFRRETLWVEAIGWQSVGARPMRWQDEDYGPLWSRRVWLEQGGGEIEFGFAMPIWANVNPIDPGTRRAIAEGCRILYDPDRVFNLLCTAVNGRA